MKDEPVANTPHPNSAGAGDLPPISERQLAVLWERRASRNHHLRTDQGARVRVLYPGRPGVTAGPDFRNAVLLVEGSGMVQGDVEVHLRQRDWVAHRHQNDPNYNGVALHVALETDAVPAVTVSGVAPPVVGLQSLVAGAEPNRAEPTDGLACGKTREQLWRLLAQHGYRQPASAEQMSACSIEPAMNGSFPAAGCWERGCKRSLANKFSGRRFARRWGTVTTSTPCCNWPPPHPLHPCATPRAPCRPRYGTVRCQHGCYAGPGLPPTTAGHRAGERRRGLVRRCRPASGNCFGYDLPIILGAGCSERPY